MITALPCFAAGERLNNVFDELEKMNDRDKRISTNDTAKEYYDMLQPIEQEHSYMHGCKGRPYEIFPMWLKMRVSLAGGEEEALSTYWFLKDGSPIGLGCFHHKLTEELRSSGGNIVYCIAPQYCGNGYGVEAVKLLVEAMQDYGIDEILFMIEKSNTPSLRCAQKCGAAVTKETDNEYFLTISNKPLFDDLNK